jgi:DNA-binding XRE family transcriptional regulator
MDQKVTDRPLHNSCIVWRKPLLHNLCMASHYRFTRVTQRNPYAVVAGRRIKQSREALDMTQEQLAKATGNKLSATRIANYEQGTRELNVQPAIILGEALKQPSCYLMGLVDELDRDILMFPAEAKMGFLTTLKALHATR